MKTLTYLSLTGLALQMVACSMAPAPKADAAPEAVTMAAIAKPHPLTADFKSYWYSGVAELNSYELKQARYGEIHEGKAVLVYVTEPFNPEKQVKADRPDASSVSVLKLNRTKNFLTGIYPYSIMSSVFYPVGDHMHALKATTSVQEWCGHIFTQLNNREDYHIQAYSYFESEADQDFHLDKSLLEDELWTRLRIRPEALPTGNHQVLPALEYLRLSHKTIQAYTAELFLSEPGEIRTYTLNYPELGRRLEIRFSGAFPYTIQGWEETYSSGFGPDTRELTTFAERIKTYRGPYWQQHAPEDVALRDSLGL